MNEIKYLGKYGLGDKDDDPSAIIRMISSEKEIKIELCNPFLGWREDPKLFKYFALPDMVSELKSEFAEKRIKEWEKNWPEKEKK